MGRIGGGCSGGGGGSGGVGGVGCSCCVEVDRYA